MLDKEICKICIQKNRAYVRWSSDDENRWKQGFVWCRQGWGEISILNLPNHCPYALEQIVC